jgi:DNA-binding CsgD family transcriptional regulator
LTDGNKAFASLQSGVYSTKVTHLAHRDVDAVLRVLPELYAAQGLLDLGGRALRAVAALVPADLIGYDQIDLTTGRIVSRSEPVTSQWQALLEVFAAHHADHPCKNDYERTGSGHARLISDFCPVAEWEASGLFNECYRPLGLRDQLSIALTQPTPGFVVAVALNRPRRNFTARDKAVLELVRPHLMSAYRIAHRFDRYEALLQGQAEASPPTPRRCGTVQVQMPRLAIAALEGNARSLMEDFFPGWGRAPGALPQELAGPLSALLARHGQSAMLRCSRTFTLPARGRVLEVTIRLAEPATLQNGSEVCLLLEEIASATHGELRRSVLSRREQDICQLLPLGLSNKEIAVQLEISPKTVGKHLENIFTKLGVSSRAAAVAAVGR